MTEDQKTAQIVNALFEKIIRVKPAFKQGWPTETEFHMAKREWVNSFKRANITSLERIKRGIERLTDSEKSFIPSPGEFIALCKIGPEDIGAPHVEQAYKEACEKSHPCYGDKKWSHEVVKMAYLASDPYLLRTQQSNKIKPIFEKNYLDACQDFSDGRNLNRIEQPVTRTFTEMEMHWVKCYEKTLEDGRWETYFPAEELFKTGEYLHSQWIKSHTPS